MKIKCPKCGSTEIWCELHDLAMKLADSSKDVLKFDLSKYPLKCLRCGNKFKLKEVK